MGKFATKGGGGTTPCEYKGGRGRKARLCPREEKDEEKEAATDSRGSGGKGRQSTVGLGPSTT